MRAAVFTCLALLATQLVVAEPVPNPAFTSERFRAHVEFLADDLLEGRDTGSPGHEIAAKYVAAQFLSLGLTPGGDAGTWYQRVTFQKTSGPGGSGSITISGPGGEQHFAHKDNVVIYPSPRHLESELTAPLVFVGFGMEDERLGLDDYAGLDVKGALVVALDGFPKGMPSEEGAHLSAMKGKVAEKHGALGIVWINTIESAAAFPWERFYVPYADEPSFGWVQGDGQVFVEAPAIRAKAMLNDPAAEAVFAGAPRSLAEVRREADQPNGKPRGFALKTRATFRAAFTRAQVSSPNVIGILPGSDPELAKQYIVLSAHLDHLAVQEAGAKSEDPDRINNGAIDNAAGVAAMLEVARVAATTADRPRRSLIFIATTGEEKGLLGADYFARHPSVPIRQIAGNVNLDCPVLTYSFSDVIAFGANHSTIGQSVARAAAPMQIKLSPDPMPEQGIFTRSDHYELVRQGVPAVFLVTGFANGGKEAYGDYFAKSYHTPKDDTSQKIDWGSGARFAEVNYRIVRMLSDSDTPPLWYEGDYFGDTFAADAQRARR